jgi:hypothetical protein
LLFGASVRPVDGLGVEPLEQPLNPITKAPMAIAGTDLLTLRA